jgi:hypothetical protein
MDFLIFEWQGLMGLLLILGGLALLPCPKRASQLSVSAL